MESGCFVMTVLTFHRFHELSLGYLYSIMQGAIKHSEDLMSIYCGGIFFRCLHSSIYGPVLLNIVIYIKKII